MGVRESMCDSDDAKKILTLKSHSEVAEYFADGQNTEYRSDLDAVSFMSFVLLQDMQDKGITKLSWNVFNHTWRFDIQQGNRVFIRLDDGSGKGLQPIIRKDDKGDLTVDSERNWELRLTSSLGLVVINYMTYVGNDKYMIYIPFADDKSDWHNTAFRFKFDLGTYDQSECTEVIMSNTDIQDILADEPGSWEQLAQTSTEKEQQQAVATESTDDAGSDNSMVIMALLAAAAAFLLLGGNI